MQIKHSQEVTNEAQQWENTGCYNCQVFRMWWCLLNFILCFDRSSGSKFGTWLSVKHEVNLAWSYVTINIHIGRISFAFLPSWRNPSGLSWEENIEITVLLNLQGARPLLLHHVASCCIMLHAAKFCNFAMSKLCNSPGLFQKVSPPP